MWIGAAYMHQQRPWMGWGPATFYPRYKGFTVYDFHTYLSENEQGLTVHNYFLLMLVEQGWIGLGLFILLTLVLFFSLQNRYRQASDGFWRKHYLAVGLALVVIYVNIALSDLIETDKIGSFFYLLLAMLALGPPQGDKSTN